MALNLARTVIDYLKDNPQTKYTANDIVKWLIDTYPAECQEKLERSEVLRTEDDLIGQLTREISPQLKRVHHKHPQLRITEGRPRYYYFTEQSESEEIAAAESGIFRTKRSPNVSELTEHSLYPLLSEYLWTEFGVYSKRIDEKRSSNRLGPNGNEWLYPDLVGMENLSANWHGEIKECVRLHADKSSKLWSFEVKLLINRSCARKNFFQAVSNSSWANFGYLVAAEIVGGDTLKELRLLSSAHGIGLIRLDAETPADSQILIPAKERPAIDWDIANRLAHENKDYREYIKLVRQFYQTGDPRVGNWDLKES